MSARRPTIGQRSFAAVAVALLVVGTTLTFLSEGPALALGVGALAVFIVVGLADLLRPEVLDWGADQGTPDANRALAGQK